MEKIVAETPHFRLVLEAAVPCLTVEWKPVTAPFDIRAALMHVHQVWHQVMLARDGRLLGLLGDTTHFAQLLPNVYELVAEWGVAMVAAGCRVLALVEPHSITGQLTIDAWVEEAERVGLPLTNWIFADAVEARAWLTQRVQRLETQATASVETVETVGLPARP